MNGRRRKGALQSGLDPEPRRMKLIFVGDVMLSRLVNDRLRHVHADYPLGDTKGLFHAGDGRACNLECVISNKGRPWSRTHKLFHFRSDARNVAVLKDAGIDAVSVANNHTLDFEYDAMLEMVSLLDRAGIYHAGAGANLADATTPAICNVKETSVGLIAFTDNEPEWEAGAQRPGLFYLPIDLTDDRAKVLLATVHQTRKLADLVIVSAHWGSNCGY
jgi:poly-gamma-glutamate capsule biosynthesis protein CapA/YwtB (metallophosphatase superfamily)